ncbi:unnamed protein product [Candidula unifasciata]|uniref:protein-lysine 6-oxidase n=1 Tax=Candidula unifasciata TaxID=100452 RepID=A0A8S3Z412_9EUPU|nr:unnamed protein product [Candidula unifasciata]
MLRYSVIILIICWLNVINSRLWIEGDIRLIGGPRRYMGTVVILHNGRWGAVCDDSWDITDASVVCRQLGYTLAVRATNQSEFGPGRKKLWLSEVGCNGTEKRLDECPLQFYDENIHNQCSGKYRSAGAICSAAIQKMTSKIKSSGTEKTTENTVKTKTDERTKNIISVTKLEAMYNWSETEIPESMKIRTTPISTFDDTAPVTSSLTVKTRDFKQEKSSAAKNVLTLATFKTSELLTPYDTSVTSTTPKSLNVTETYVYIENYHNSPPDENKTYQFINNRTADYNSSRLLHQEMKVAMPLKCSMVNQDTEGCEDYLEDDPNVQNFEIRLKGGRYKWEGHLQIRINKGSWGTVCSDHWTLTEAMVACNQLRDIGQAKQTLQTSYFGGIDVPKNVYKIQCVGRELTFDSCNVTWSDKDHSCSKNTAVAGVVCSQHLPDLVPNLRAVEESVRLQDQPLYYLRCAMEENCLASSAYTIRNTSLTWRNTMRRLLRFSTVVHNRGMADFRPYRPRGQWEWHACHMHYHSMEIFAHYDILNSNGTRLAEGSKASFCLEDTTCDKGVHPNYNCRGFADQGLSVNCSDNYMYDIDCQWIDISELKPGDYTFLMEVNPTMLVAESNFDNNIVSCRLYYSGYFASVRDCHYESLLDYTHRDRQNKGNNDSAVLTS